MMYKLYVWCRRHGVSCDAGLHDRIETDNEQTAFEYLRNSGEWLLNAYDEVHCTVKKGDEEKGETEVEVARYTLRPRPAKTVDKSGSMYPPDYFLDEMNRLFT